MQAPALAARCMKKSAGRTPGIPCWRSADGCAAIDPQPSAGFNPAAPLTAAITQSAGRAAASIDRAFSAGAAFDLGCRQAPPSTRRASWRRQSPQNRAAEFLGELGQFPSTLEFARQRLDLGRRSRCARAANPWCCRRSNRWRPRTVTDRTGPRGRGLVVTQMEQRSSFHQTIRPRPTPSAPPRRNPKKWPPRDDGRDKTRPAGPSTRHGRE